jgi:hypothetical protein
VVQRDGRRSSCYALDGHQQTLERQRQHAMLTKLAAAAAG